MDKQEIYAFVEKYFAAKNHAWLTGDVETVSSFHGYQEEQPMLQEVMAHEQFYRQREIRSKKAATDVHVTSYTWDESREQATVEVTEQIQWIYRDGIDYEEEARIYRHALYIQPYRGTWQIIRCDTQLEPTALKETDTQQIHELQQWSGQEWQEEGYDHPGLQPQDRFQAARVHLYDRMQAMKYAEMWWDRFNPAYRKFEVDCTNFVSQCLNAGHAPMVGMGNRSKGWWYRHQGGKNDNWSYSWAVANSLRWFLGGKGYWHATIVNDPTELKVGDVICYDWEGDNHWTHNTIVVGFDRYNRPLVNAHTVESHRRYWDYRDSYAWTQRTQYIFLRIPDQF